MGDLLRWRPVDPTATTVEPGMQVTNGEMTARVLTKEEMEYRRLESKFGDGIVHITDLSFAETNPSNAEGE